MNKIPSKLTLLITCFSLCASSAPSKSMQVYDEFTTYRGNSSKSGYAEDPENLPSLPQLQGALLRAKQGLNYEQNAARNDSQLSCGEEVAAVQVRRIMDDIALSKEYNSKP